MRGTPKNALRFLGTPTRPYGSGTMFGVARIALAIRDGPRLGCGFFAIPGPTMSPEAAICVPPFLSICTGVLNLRTQPAGTRLSSLTFAYFRANTIFALEPS